jgi:hypothetical protein
LADCVQSLRLNLIGVFHNFLPIFWAKQTLTLDAYGFANSALTISINHKR